VSATPGNLDVSATRESRGPGIGTKRHTSASNTAIIGYPTRQLAITFRRMSMPADYHMHTPLCQHATGEPVEYAARAAKLGLPEIGFSDHSPMRKDNFDTWRMNFDKLGQYVESVRKAQKDFPRLNIKLAMEVDYLPGQEEWIREMAGMYPWDYFIGSVHYVSESWAIDDPSKLSEWKTRDPFEVWSRYFDWLTRAAGSGLFEIIGHADLPKKFGIVPKEDCSELFEKFLKEAVRTNTAIELNTAGLRKACKEIYPSPKLLQMAREIGVAITFGSDAHAPEEVGMNFGDAVTLAKEVGYRECCRFTQRKRTMVEI
jgi:histidinol-phosphatase (PHP family)